MFQPRLHNLLRCHTLAPHTAIQRANNFLVIRHPDCLSLPFSHAVAATKRRQRSLWLYTASNGTTFAATFAMVGFFQKIESRTTGRDWQEVRENEAHTVMEVIGLEALKD